MLENVTPGKDNIDSFQMDSRNIVHLYHINRVRLAWA